MPAINLFYKVNAYKPRKTTIIKMNARQKAKIELKLSLQNRKIQKLTNNQPP